ncbi:MAG: hypothetical protein AAF696_35125 [Bacteroidota bacterium]
MHSVLTYSLILFLISGPISVNKLAVQRKAPVQVLATNTCQKSKPGKNFSYKVIHKEPVMENLRMIGKVTKCGVDAVDSQTKNMGRVLRALRFQNISERVEKKYDLPKNLVLAMVIQETGGADMLPNCLDDGGIGICHMQGSTASDFGLKTYKGFNLLKSKTHGRILRSLIEKNNYDRKKLIQHDDRFHPILNLDAVGRMLSCYRKRRKKTGETDIQVAIKHYAGAYNYRHYWRNVVFFRKTLNDEKFLKSLEKEFNKRNPNLKINGKAGDFDGYINAHQEQNLNYGLAAY